MMMLMVVPSSFFLISLRNIVIGSMLAYLHVSILDVVIIGLASSPS